MKIAMTIAALALLAAGCASDPQVRRADRNDRSIALCPEKSRVYENGVYVSCKQSGQLTQEAQRAADHGNSYRYYGGNTAENVRNTPYENARIDAGLALFGKSKN